MNKIKLFGRGYIVDYCIAYFRKEQEDKALVNYVTKGLQFISENVAVIGKAYNSDGHYLAIAYEDLFTKPITMTAEQIVDNVINKCGLGG